MDADVYHGARQNDERFFLGARSTWLQCAAVIKSWRNHLVSLSIVALLGMGAVAGCGGGGDDGAEDDPTAGEDVDADAEPAGGADDGPSTDDTAPTLPAGSSYVASARGPRVIVYNQATGDDASNTLANPTPGGAPLVFLVDGADVEGDRIPVFLPVKPNGSKGWVNRTQVKLTTNPYHVKVELAAHRLTVTKDAEPIIESAVGLGEAGKDTPAGTYFLKELLENPTPEDSYGPYAYGISAFTENPSVAARFGDDGVIGIHGTNDPSSIGQNRSNGCIRLPNDVITEMAGILPLGTPVEILA